MKKIKSDDIELTIREIETESCDVLEKKIKDLYQKKEEELE